MTFVANAAGKIAARAITVTAAGSTKGYDGTASAAATPSIAAGSLAAGDTAAFSEAFDTRNAGTGKTLGVAGSVADGNTGANYAVTCVADAAGAVAARAITVTAAPSTRTYDGTTSAARQRRRSPRAVWPRAIRRPSAKPTIPGTRVRAKTLTRGRVGNDGNGGQQLQSCTLSTAPAARSTARPLPSPPRPSPRPTMVRPARRRRRRLPPAAWPRSDTPALSETYDTKNAGTGETLVAAGYGQRRQRRQ